MIYIGAVTFDLTKKQRHYDAKYPLDQPYGVRAFLDDWRALRAAAYERSDFDALNVLLDGEQALKDAGLTQKQTAALRLVFTEQFTQEEAAEVLGLAGKPGVNNLVQRAVNRVAEAQGYDEEAYAEWAEVYYGKGTR